MVNENNKFIASIYLKPIFPGLYTTVDNFILETYKKGLVSLSLFCRFLVCSDLTSQQDANLSKNTLSKNEHHANLICTMQL